MKSNVFFKASASAFIMFILLTTAAFTQTKGVGIGTNTPAQSAILDLDSKNRGFLVPRMTESERTAIALPATGLLVYQESGTVAEQGFWYFDGGQWKQLGMGADEIHHYSINPSTTNAIDGQLIYNTTEKQYYFCMEKPADTKNWVPLVNSKEMILHVSILPTANSSLAGQIVYDTANKKYYSCDGTNWFVFGAIDHYASEFDRNSAIGSPSDGYMVYQADKHSFYYYKNGTWVPLVDSTIVDSSKVILHLSSKPSNTNGFAGGQVIYVVDDNNYYYNDGSNNWKIFVSGSDTTTKLMNIAPSASGENGSIDIGARNYVKISDNVTDIYAGSTVGQIVVLCYSGTTVSIGTHLDNAIVIDGSTANVKLRQKITADGGNSNAIDSIDSEPFYKIKDTTITLLWDGTNWVEIGRTQDTAIVMP